MICNDNSISVFNNLEHCSSLKRKILSCQISFNQLPEFKKVISSSFHRLKRLPCIFYLLLCLFLLATPSNGQYLVGKDYSYCASNTTDDPCLYYLCDTNHCTECADSYAHLMVDPNTTVCAEVDYQYSDTYEEDMPFCYVIDPIYVDLPYYSAAQDGSDVSYFFQEGTFTWDYICMAKDLYFQTMTPMANTCGDYNAWEPDRNIIAQYLTGYTIGCDYCNQTGYNIHSLNTNVTFLDEYYYVTYGEEYSYDEDLVLLMVRSCAPGIDLQGATCGKTEYFNAVRQACEPCACKFQYCLYCNSTSCLLTNTELAFYPEYTDVIKAYCLNDPCSTYQPGTNICSNCQTFDCFLDQETDTYNCKYYGYLFVDSNTTVCSYAQYVQQKHSLIRQCNAQNSFYSLGSPSYYNQSYNSTGSQLVKTYCVQCSTFFSFAGQSICSDNCEKNATYSDVETYINKYSVGCGACNVTGFQNQRLSKITYLTETVYMRECFADYSNGVHCKINEYLHPYFQTCQACACKFTNCAACTFNQCLLTADFIVNTSACVYTSDPCLTYSDATKTKCTKCIDVQSQIQLQTNGPYYNAQYQLMVVDSTYTVCAYLTSTTERNVCVLGDTFYKNDPTFKASYSSIFDKQYTALGTNKYCIACDRYFAATDSSGAAINYCSDSCNNYAGSLDYYHRSINSYSIGCGTCSITSHSMQTVTAVTHITGLFIKTCEANPVVAGKVSASCTFTQWYNSTSNACQNCYDLYPNCAACNTSGCILCADSFYYANRSFYDVLTATFVMKGQCVYKNCPVGQGISETSGQSCISCGVPNCQTCGTQQDSNGINQFQCFTCTAGYSLLLSVTLVGTQCVQQDLTLQNKVYYVASGAATTDVSTTLGYYYIAAGLSPSAPYYFIQTALYDIAQASSLTPNMNVTIYIGKGNHFFFFCDTTVKNTQAGASAQTYTDYCDYSDPLNQNLVKRFLKQRFASDNINITVQALDCSFAPRLGLTGNAYFLAMCTDQAYNESNYPVINVNQAYASFFLTGNATFINLRFSGINQFSTSNTLSLAYLPVLGCQVTTEPTPSTTSLTLTAVTNAAFPSTITCSTVKPVSDAAAIIPRSVNSEFICSRNGQDQFYPSQESTLAAEGELKSTNFFYYGDQFISRSSTVPPKRRKTLFELNALPDHKSISKTIPKLDLVNCTFEYFLNSYESLINVNTNEVYNSTTSQTYFANSPALITTSTEFFTYEGSERGAKINIRGSKFKHSKFSKGMLVYRKQPYSTAFGMANYTAQYMTSGTVQSAGSYIILQNSQFYNLNFLDQVAALALTGTKELKTSIYNYLSSTTVTYAAFHNKGIILNVEDFGGDIEIMNCNITANMHYIPSILITNYSASDILSDELFKDTSTTFEMKFAICNQETFVDQYYFMDRTPGGLDLDSGFDSYERLTTLYISRQRGALIIRDNLFLQNIGTFGGAITINSPNGQTPSQSTGIVLYNNTFLNNMGYISGNAIYIRYTKRKPDMSTVCGGRTLIASNAFAHNFGLKNHNGGAIGAICSLIVNLHEDYRYSSAQANLTQDQTSSFYISDLLNKQIYFVPYYQFQAIKNNFSENYSGLRGSAFYIKYVNIPYLAQNYFFRNGPVFSAYEKLYSPYYNYFGKKTITFYDQNGVCTTEFQYLAKCTFSGSQIEQSMVKGAVYVEHCQIIECMVKSNIMNLTLINSQFVNNQIGPIIDSQLIGSELASQVYILGGYRNYLSQLTMRDMTGLYASVVSSRAQALSQYFPAEYFNYQMAPLIRVDLSPITQYSSDFLYFDTIIDSCHFINNKHIQTLGLSTTQMYKASLISYTTNFESLFAKYLPTLTIQSSVISDNQFSGPDSTLIYVYNGRLVFTNNVVNNIGKLTSVTVSNNQNSGLTYVPFYSFTNVKLSQTYGLLYLAGNQAFKDGYFHSIQNNQFQYTFSEFGSVFNFYLDYQYVVLKSNTYNYNFATRSGSILNAINQVGQSLIKMDQESILFQFSYNGTLTIHSSNQMSLIINNTQMSNLYATQAAALNLDSPQKVILNNCQLAYADQNRTLKNQIERNYESQNLILNDLIDTSTFALLTQNYTVNKLAHVNILNSNGANQNNFASLLTQNSSDPYESYVEIINSQFSNLSASQASVLQITGSSVVFRNKVGSGMGITNCSQKTGGAIYVNNFGVFEGVNLMIRNTTSDAKSSVILVNQYSEARFQNTVFYQNKAGVQSLATVQGSSSFNCSFCNFTQNYASDSSIIFADNNPDGQITISDSTFTNNTSESNMFYIIYTSISIFNSSFLNNIANSVNHGFTLSNSQLYLHQVNVTYNDPILLSLPIQPTETGFLSINFKSTLAISNSTFTSCLGKTAGVISASGQSNISIDSSSLFQQSRSQNGGTIYLQSTNLAVIQSSQFIDNGLSDIWVTNAKVIIERNLFQGGDQQFVYGDSAMIVANENVFQNGANYDVMGRGIYCFCDSMDVNGNTFSNLSAAGGGAIYITSATTQSAFSISNNTFSSNFAQLGGAVYIQDGASVQISNNTFNQNMASLISPPTQTTTNLGTKGQGGAIFYNCFNSNLGLTGKCKVTIGEENIFSSNQAQNDGGAINWVSNNFTDDGTNLYMGNQAYYGNNIGSYPSDLNINFFSNNDYINPINNQKRRRLTAGERQLDSSNGFSSLVSGIPVSFAIAILDANGNVYTADSSSVATIQPSGNETFIQNNVVTAVFGVYNFSNLIVYTPQGSSVSLTLNIQGLNTYGNSISFLDTPLQIQTQFRNCVQGEELTSSNACLACPKDSFIYFVPNKPESCYTCDSAAANCYGQNKTSPLPGYWRANATTESWQECPRPTNCKGGNESQPTGECEVGYMGTACAECMPNYSRQADFVCALCPPRIRNIVQISFLMAFAVGYTAFLVRSSMKGAQETKPVYSVYLKVMTNYFQVIGAISNIDYHWPDQIQKFFNSQVKTSQVAQQIFSFDCFLQDSSGGISPYYEKLMFYALSPFIMTGISAIFWAIHCRIKKDFSYFSDCTISTIVILLFLIHPNITQSMFDAFNCIEIDGTFYLRGDMGSKCYQGKHTFYIYVIVVPSCVLWVIGIPLFALLCLVKNKHIVMKSQSEDLDVNDKKIVYNLKMKYGFLFQGYRLNIYYWEIVLLYRKIALIMATVFLSVVSPEAQVLVAMVIVFANMIAHIFLVPLDIPILNQIEMYSLMVASITMYCGMFFITGEHYTYMDNNGLKWFFLFCLIVPNALYFAYWVWFFQTEIFKEIFRKSEKLFRIVTCRMVDLQKFADKHKIQRKGMPKVEQTEENEGGAGGPDEKNSEQKEDFSGALANKMGDKTDFMPVNNNDIKLDFSKELEEETKKMELKNKKKEKKRNFGEDEQEVSLKSKVIEDMDDEIPYENEDKINYNSQGLPRSRLTKNIEDQDEHKEQDDPDALKLRELTRFKQLKAGQQTQATNINQFLKDRRQKQQRDEQLSAQKKDRSQQSKSMKAHLAEDKENVSVTDIQLDEQFKGKHLSSMKDEEGNAYDEFDDINDKISRAVQIEESKKKNALQQQIKNSFRA